REYYEENFDVEILLDADPQSIQSTDAGVSMTVDHEGETREIEGDRTFAFTGRTPALDGLNLEATALDPGEGWVRDTMQTTADDRVYVVGDANGRLPILHVAKEEGMQAAENVLHDVADEPLETYDPIHHQVIFSGLGVLPFARVGHTEATARKAGYDPVVVASEASSDGVFAAKNVPEGRATLVVARDGTVLGYQGLHYHADAMAKTMQIVVEGGLDVRALPDRAYHPTTPEILDSLFGDAVAELATDA
ncbi:MAG: FAD-dependent oxidoreductase, partial [Halanaeroarchaeum sp.]